MDHSKVHKNVAVIYNENISKFLTGLIKMLNERLKKTLHYKKTSIFFVFPKERKL